MLSTLTTSRVAPSEAVLKNMPRSASKRRVSSCCMTCHTAVRRSTLPSALDQGFRPSKWMRARFWLLPTRREATVLEAAGHWDSWWTNGTLTQEVLAWEGWTVPSCQPRSVPAAPALSTGALVASAGGVKGTARPPTVCQKPWEPDWLDQLARYSLWLPCTEPWAAGARANGAAAWAIPPLPRNPERLAAKGIEDREDEAAVREGPPTRLLPNAAREARGVAQTLEVAADSERSPADWMSKSDIRPSLPSGASARQKETRIAHLPIDTSGVSRHDRRSSTGVDHPNSPPGARTEGVEAGLDASRACILRSGASWKAT